MVKIFADRSITRRDLIVACILICVLTFQPGFANGPLNLFELGLYLPSIDGVLHGLIPYKDFFYLRGPLEIYIPALIMHFLGENTSVMALFFYLGNVACLIMACLIAAEFLQTRWMFYIFLPTLIGRCFPRVVFAYWGGLRYFFGLIFIYVLIKAAKNKKSWLFVLAGFLGSCALMTSVEIGICCIVASLIFFGVKMIQDNQNDQQSFRQVILHIAGYGAGLIPWFGFFFLTGALLPFLASIEAVVFRSHPTFMTHLTSTSPKSIGQFLLAMIPGMNNFKYMTPMYCFIITAGILGWRWFNRRFKEAELGLTALWAYGFVLYWAAFRIIEGGQFETALQIEKILYCVVLEVLLLSLWSRRATPKIDWQKTVTTILLIVCIFSWGYVFVRGFKRFPVFFWVRSQVDSKYRHKQDMKQGNTAVLTIPHAKGIVTSKEQAQELEEVYRIVAAKTLPQDKIFVYPDMGSYYFLNERPVTGYFPVGTLSWMRPDWAERLVRSLSVERPKLIIVKKVLEPDFQNVYFKKESNVRYYNEVMSYIENNYVLYATTVKSKIYMLKVFSI